MNITGETSSYAYDDVGNLDLVTQSDGILSDYAYDALRHNAGGHLTVIWWMTLAFKTIYSHFICLDNYCLDKYILGP